MQEKVRNYIKDYYKDKTIDKSELIKLKSTTFVIKEKVVNLADLLIFCTPYLPEDARYVERLYNIINNIYEKPICPVCNTNTCNFKNYNSGYFQTCSIKCNNSNSNKKLKIKNTNLEKYGTEYPNQNIEIQNKKKQTNLIKYGVEHYSQTDEYKEKVKNTSIDRYGVNNYTQTNEYKERCKSTCIQLYGVENTFQVEEFKKKSRQTCMQKFGTEYYSQTNEYKEKCKETWLNNYNVDNPLKHVDIKIKALHTYKEKQFDSLLLNKERLNNCTPLFDLEEFKNNKISDNYKWKWKCNVCTKIFYDDLEDGSKPVCPKCYKRYGSNLQKEIYEFVYSYVPDIHLNDRRFGFEIDILLEKYNLGIEVNGNYWHSESRGKDRFYHLNKTIECAKNNINLIHIFEDEWLYKKDIVKSIILSKLNIYTFSYNSDDLNIYKIDEYSASIFLNANHLLGEINNISNIKHYGLVDSNNTILSLMSISSNNKIHRYCNVNYCKVNNGLKKLVNHILKNDKIITYCDLRYEDKELFESAGFEYLKFKYPNYYYVDENDYNNRINKSNNISKTNYDKIWDCGSLVFIFNI